MEKRTTQLKTVLLVEDDANIRLIAQTSLEGLTDWNLLIASSGMQALQIAAQTLPELILLDVMMPEMDGLTTFAELKKKYAENMPKVIFMTAKAQRHELDSYIKMGAVGVITKPFDPMQLPKQILDILDNAYQQI